MDEATIERVILWMISGLRGSDLRQACVNNLNVEPAQVADVLAQARRRLTVAADYNRDELLGTAITRLNDLYSRCMLIDADTRHVANLPKALDVQKELNRLTGLYSAPAGTEAPAEGESESAEELRAVAEHLHAMQLTGTEYPLREHARLAVERIRALEAERAIRET